MNKDNYTQQHFEDLFRQELYQYLIYINKVDEHLPDAPDMEAQWAKIGESYLPDALREFTQYPTVSLGWIMFVGMAVTKYWDEDWERYGKMEDLYKHLCDNTDFDHLDDYILQQVLQLDSDRQKAMSMLVGECAQRCYHQLLRQHLEPGSAEAFRAFIAALHQLYLMGVAVELRDLGYHMAKL